MNNPVNSRLRGAVKLALAGGATTVDLSDLGANRILVLVNGLRLAPSAPRVRSTPDSDGNPKPPDGDAPF
jgi:hypothetical protein